MSCGYHIKSVSEIHTHNCTVTLTDSEYAAVKELAECAGTTMSEVLRTALKFLYEQHNLSLNGDDYEEREGNEGKQGSKAL